MDDNDVKSEEEKYFLWYLKELEDEGFISSFEYEGMQIDLANSVDTKWHEALKTKVKTRSRNLVQGISYIPDFVIEWNESAKGVFIDDEMNGCLYMPPFVSQIEATRSRPVSVVDTKGDYDPNNMNRLFEMKRKWVLSEKGIYVHKVVPEKFFKKTFTPQRYLLTDITKKPRKLNYKPRTLDQFTKTMRYGERHMGSTRS